MELRLDGLNITVEDPYVQENDVFVDFEFDTLEGGEVKFYLKVYVGKEEYDCRFSMRIIYIVDTENEIFDEEYIMVKKAVQMISESMIEIIIVLDSLIKRSQERLN
ncbi:MAG: hypothetical protein RR428_01235 [Coprobacillus sp.]